MTGFVFKAFALAIGILLVAYAAANALRNARRLDRRIQEFKEEQEAQEKQGKAINPYAALAELYPAEDSEKEQAARRKPRRRS